MAKKTKGGLCQPAQSYLLIMILMYVTTLIITFVDKTTVTDELRNQVYSPQGIIAYVIKVAIWVGILSILCRYKCFCLANIFVFFGALAYLGVLLYLLSILVGVDVVKMDKDVKKQEAHKEQVLEDESAPEGFSL